MFKLPIRRKKRHILHIDADAFFASVEQVLNPKLRGEPVLVGGPSGTKGIVSAASYEAKRMGVKTGMPMFKARRLCPKGIIVPGNFEAYRRASRGMYEIFTKFTPDVEMASIDEAYLDITGYDKAYGKTSPEIAREILMEVYKNIGISVSCGLSSNKTVSKTASSQNKPHKLTVVPYGKEQAFLAPLPVGAIPGIGPRTVASLERYGLKRVGDVAGLRFEEVLEKFGVQGVPIWKKCLGIDNSEVISVSSLPKSISKERTIYDGGLMDKEVCVKFLKSLSTMVFEKLRRYEMKAKTVYVRVRYKNEPGVTGFGVGFVGSFGSAYGGGLKSGAGKMGRHGFEDFVFTENLGGLMSADSELWPIAKKLFLKNLDGGKVVRQLGIGVSGLVRNYNMSLFPSIRTADELFGTIDGIRRTYGDNGASFGTM